MTPPEKKVSERKWSCEPGAAPGDPESRCPDTLRLAQNARSAMVARKGEKFGWIGGWSGGFLWVIILSAVFFVQDKVIPGAVGLCIACAAVVLIVAGAPWRHPHTPYWKLMIPVYLVFFGAIAWLVWSWGGDQELGLNWWNAFLLLPLLIPFATAGRRRWSDGRV
jgi:hypothetical protein